MTDRIRSLRIEGFRGATQPFEMEFDNKKPVTLIFGENGTGKSTIVDALEFVGTGQTSFVDAWKVGTRKNSFIPTLGKTLSDVVISMQVNGKSFQATLSASGVNLDKAADRPMVKVLRRKSLQAFIEAIPSERYREVAAFLDIPQIEASEASLREALKDHKEQFDRAAAMTGQARQQLQGLWEGEGSPGADGQSTAAESWAREQAQADPHDLKAVVEQSQKRIESIREMLRLEGDYKAKKTALSGAIEKRNAAQAALQTAEKEATQGNSQLSVLLKDARDYLSATPDEICPVCEETKIDAGALVARLDKRLATMAALTQANAAAAQANQQHKSFVDQLERAQERLISHAVSTSQLLEKSTPAYAKLESAAESDKAQAVKLVESLASKLSTELPALEAALEEARRKVHTLSSIRQAVMTVDKMTSEAKRQEALSRRLEKALKLVESQRKYHVEKVLTQIASEVDQLYQQIHPGEHIGGIQLKLDDKKRGSLLYGVAFADATDLHPQPYYSESHLDTLGLCIFLALAKRLGAGCIVVLDDVLGSVDQQHLNRTLDMLLNEAENFGQIVLTSHYRPLRDRFRYAHNAAQKVQTLELKPWSISGGIRSAETPTYRDELKAKLADDNFERESVASQAGILFESLLEFISLTYRCRVPHLPEPRYTFGDLASAPNNKLKNALIVSEPKGEERQEIALAPIFEKLREAIAVRNLVGCHFNQWAGELSDENVREMASLAVELADALICTECGSLPVSDKSGTHWACACAKTHMQPLQQPK